jgi:hypothetical protein
MCLLAENKAGKKHACHESRQKYDAADEKMIICLYLLLNGRFHWRQQGVVQRPD